MKNFNFVAPVNIKFGEKAINVLDEIKNKKILILTFPELYKNGCYDNVLNHLTGNKIVLITDIEPNPTCDNIDNALKVARDNQVELIIAVGGGSIMDVAKCVSLIMLNGGKALDYLYGKKIVTAGLPLYCIPTTSGTGSEVTNVAVISEKSLGIKRPIVSSYMLPKYALIIPSMTLTVPPRITAETGWDAFTHSIEAYWNKESNPISDAIAKDAIKLILENINTAYNNGSDINARENLALASLMAGVAFAQTRTTALHGLSFRFTSHYKISHGRACVLTLLPILKAINNTDNIKMQQLVHYLGYDNSDMFYADLKSKLIATGMPLTLAEVNVPISDIDNLVDDGMKNGIIFLTPLEMTREFVYNIFMDIAE